MYFSTHLMVGAVTGRAVGTPLLAFAGGVVSHLILDMLPHHDYRRTLVGVVDLIVGLSILFCLYSVWRDISLLAGAIGGTVPDLEVAIGHLRGRPIRYFPSHTGLLPHGKTSSPWGVYGQLILIAIITVLLAR